MKILHFLDTVNRGGAETLVLDVCRHAAPHDLDISFAAAGGGALEADFADSGARYFRLRRRRRLPLDPVLISRLRRAIRENSFDIVHTHQAVEALHALAATAGTRTRVVLTHHGIIPDRKNLFATKFLLARVAHNVVVGAAARQVYETEFGFRFPPRRTSVIYNGVDVRRLQPSETDFRRAMGFARDDLLFGMVGNFYPEARKDQMTVCRALPRIFAALPRARCLFVGKAEAGAESKFAACVEFCQAHGIADRVHFLGARRDVPDVLHALDLFVFSSRKEGLPIAVNEAMLAGVPVVASDIAPLLEATGGGEFAEIFPVGAAEILSDEIVTLLESETRRADLARRAKRFAEENFSIEAHLESLRKLYESLLPPVKKSGR